MANFKPGDVVQLKSGGPLMTVTEVGGDPRRVWAVWFDQSGKEQNGSYPETALVAERDHEED